MTTGLPFAVDGGSDRGHVVVSAGSCQLIEDGRERRRDGRDGSRTGAARASLSGSSARRRIFRIFVSSCRVTNALLG